ncbi:MAG: diacylglycerol/lipid kinase family protein [Myxococcaceae bacterium]
MKTFLVVNPRSANGQTGKRWAELSSLVSRRIGEFGHAFTTGPMDAAAVARKAIKDGYRLIVAVGGDGTVNEVVNGFFEDGKVLEPGAALGLIPRGTGGDFRKTFGWSVEVDEAVARLEGEKTQAFDVGVLEYTTPAGTPATRYFANICSFGVSGQVDAAVNKASKALGGKLSFMIASAKALVRYKDRKVRIVADGGAPELLTVTTLAVANGRYFGGGMMVAPLADPADGLFDVTVWSGYGLTDFALKAKYLYDGSHTKWDRTRTFRCKSLLAESDEEVLLDVDGEQPGRLPCKMTILPGAIRLKV